MSEFKGTPGRWVAYGSEVCTSDYVCDGQTMLDHICSCESVNGESPNARLIAAAPELLEALQELLFLYEHDEGCRELTEYKRAKATIEKALGQ